MFKLDGKVALITGAGQNIGAGVAKAMAEQGATVIVNDFFSDRATSVADEIKQQGGQADVAAFDVTNREAVNVAVAEIIATHGAIDILVNNAGNAGAGGRMQFAPFADTSPDYWPKILDVNLNGLFYCVQAVLPGMQARRNGRIIVNTSGAGQRGLDIGVSTYGAAKAGQIGFMRHLTIEAAPYGITCNTISVGLVLENAEAVQHLADAIPLKRLGRPSDIGYLAVYLASDEASWISGQVIGANGGALMP